MTGMDGINSLQKMLGALQVNDATSVNGTAAATASKTAGTTATATAGSSVDRTSLSAAGLASQATDTSDVRIAKVAELRSAILSGTYSVSSSDVADKMVESMLK